MQRIILGIHTNVDGNASSTSADGSFSSDAGHAWLAITQSGTTTTYGLWPDWNSNPRVINNGNASDIRVGLELNSKAAASRYYMLTGPQAIQFNRLMSANVHWKYTHNCASFASDTVYEIFKEDVDADDYLGFETPRELGKSILLLEAKSPTSMSNPRTLLINPTGKSN